ncbi:MAG TPA: MMPL family transporter, partial [Candidatus Angelobacter sp.]|nr:MMPL family transporter [Candidatus Angelobacter sp.]
MRHRFQTIALAIAGLLASIAAGLAAWRRLAPRRRPDGRLPEPFAAAPTTPVGGRPPRRPVDLEPHPTGAFAALGRFDYRFRRLLPVLGLALMIGLQVWASQAGGTLIQGGWVIEGSEEQQAADLLADRFGQQASTIIFIFTDPDGDAAAPGFQDQVADALEPIADDELVADVTTYGESPVDELLSEDGTKTLAVVTLTEDEESAVEKAAELAAEVEAPDGVAMQITGIPQLYHEFNEQIEADLIQGELISLPIALLILLTVFGTLVGAVLPIVVALIALPSAFAVVSLLAGVMDMSIFVMNLASMIGLALAIDYSLFLVSRYREELEHHPVEIAIERMMGSVGKAVAVSGIAVAIGMSSLIVFEAEALRSMGIGGVITVLSTLVFGLTVLPALLAMLGPRVNRLRVPLPKFLRLEDDPDRAEARRGHGVWGWIAARVMRRPILIATPVLALLLLAGSPFLSIQLSTGQNLEDLPPTPAREAFLDIVEEFPGGESDPITVAVQYDDGDLAAGGISAERQADLAEYIERIERLDGITGVESALDPPPGLPAAQYEPLLALPAGDRPPEVAEGLGAYLEDWVAADVLRLRVFSDTLPDSEAGRGLVDEVRAI